MSGEELIIPIDKAYWPKGVMRSLPPVLRELGDRNGNLVIAAVPNKHIMVRGEEAKIKQCKPGLKDVLAEHFPDLPTPEELQDEKPKAKSPVASPKKSPSPSPKKSPKASPKKAPEPAPAAAAPATKAGWGMFGGSKKDAAVQKKAESASDAKVVAGRKRPRPASWAPSALIWQCTRANSSFIRNSHRQCIGKPFSAEPHNLLSIHSSRFSGNSSTEALDVRPVKHGKKESVVLFQSNAKSSRLSRPSSRTFSTGLSKCIKNGMKALSTELDRKYYRKDLKSFAEKKYIKVLNSFKTRKVKVRSRRSKE